jgi:hypothetical protein
MKVPFTLSLLFAGLLISSSSSAQLASAVIDTNYIHSGINSDGSAYNPATGASQQFIVPKGTGKSPIYVTNLWLAGTSNGSAKVSAIQFKQNGTDFWSGPINPTTGVAADPTAWNKVWKVNKSTINGHIANYNTTGYTVPQQIADWPGNGPAGFAPVMAPFYDKNGNGIYEPSGGDYPTILGDQALYAIFNDAYASHTETGGQALQAEVHLMEYEYVSSTVSNTLFCQYKIVNRSSSTWTDFYAGIFTDFDLGYPGDDYIATDSLRSMYYVYNADSVDGTGAGTTYGNNPPAMAIQFLNTALKKSMTWQNNATIMGNAFTYQHYYTYLKGLWKDSTSLTYGGNGYGGSVPTSLTYTGDPVTLAGWSERSVNATPGDVRMLGSTGPYTVAPGAYITVDVAYIYAPNASTNNLNAVTTLKSSADNVRSFYNNTIALSNDEKRSAPTLQVYPNPAQGSVTVKVPVIGEPFSIRLFDLQGNLVINVESKETIDLDVSGFSNGIYYLSVGNEKYHASQKLVILNK